MSKFQLKPQSIYCGDNLKMLKDIPDKSIDMIYIDPPFNSNRNYETFWGDVQEKRAFNDRFGDADAYIHYMRPRVVELYRVLKDTGTFFYHCDWHASHYVKIMLDQIFSFNNFQTEIIWQRKSSSAGNKSLSNSHDTIFYYNKSKNFTFNMLYVEYDQDYVKTQYKHQDEKGYYRHHDVVANPALGGTTPRYEYKGYIPKTRWLLSKEKLEELDKENKLIWSKTGRPYRKMYLNEMKGEQLSDVWTDIPISLGKERMGYPTQKPIALMDRVINMSTNKGDIILDAFCGCGTTLVSAEKLKRKWIGIDISPTACRVMAQRLYDLFKLDEGKDFEVRDLPRTESELMELPPFEFQNWAVIALGGIPNQIKVGDYGIDGKLYPVEIEKGKQEGLGLFGDIDIYYPIQVKQKDKAGRPDIDNFETAIRRDGRKKGYFLAFSFSKDAIQEIKRLDKEGEIEIIPITVKDLLKMEQYRKN
ncbi:MAG: restriction endonuclease [Ignavibacteria bacterium]|nr:restriction endonuclease [Ignavibacteria bacterium]